MDESQSTGQSAWLLVLIKYNALGGVQWAGRRWGRWPSLMGIRRRLVQIQPSLLQTLLLLQALPVAQHYAHRISEHTFRP